jgi:hypothetical protein
MVAVSDFRRVKPRFTALSAFLESRSRSFAVPPAVTCAVAGFSRTVAEAARGTAIVPVAESAPVTRLAPVTTTARWRSTR